ncbi:RTA1 like protein-domain-containing protein [Aspergillus pseudotamarii]|uniref:RTA1 like protein-domain-containing protein n=1 Tax=Aspergillus pseudotamarii TaxID=132259 RepID=A0A5N6SJB2_ASPPS|nr:RTA1 like protein-domain-containing protein [Aspergillus pseudotamarii]KAE8133989.1 RTA1 like protein-domain-containing protein [Aspergillus pseudotamarii]
MADSKHTDWTAYHYYPSKAAGILFVVLFLILSVIHTYRLLRTRAWFFVPLVTGTWFEAVGYIGRVLSANESPDWTISPYVMQSTLLLVAPALYAASIYMELGRIIHLVKASRSAIIRVTWMTKIFVAGDLLSFLMQASGAGIMVSNSKSTGENIILGGLFVQIIFFGFFLISALVFQRRLTRSPTSESADHSIPWQKHMFALHFSSLLILIRSGFRVVEYIQGSDGFLLRNEVFIYVYDGLLMLFVTVVFLAIHPGEFSCLLGQ